MSQERFYKLPEVQHMLSVSRSTLWRWTVENGLKIVRVGGVTRIRESDLQAFLKRHESGSGGAVEKLKIAC
jgi:excisionase family DNA binding protein